jgi:hypothetical protein
MACTTPPAIVVGIQVAATSPVDLAFTKVSSNDAKLTVSKDGDLHFRKFKCAVSVTMQFTDGNTFYKGGGKDALSFANDPDTLTYGPVVTGGQFSPLPFTRSGGNTTITFSYFNGDGCKAFKYSGYGIYVADSQGNYLGEYDPIVSNGGNGDALERCSMVRPYHHHHHHHHHG